MTNPPSHRNRTGLKILLFVLVSCGLIGLSVVWTGMEDETTLVLPIEFTGLDAGFVVSSGSVERVTVHIQGKSRKLDRLSPVPCRVDVSGRSAGVHHVMLKPSMLAFTSGVEAFKIEPDTIAVTIETRSEKEVPVVVSHLGDPSRGYRIAGIMAVPDTVVVSGPASIVDPLDSVPTKPVDISGATESIKKTVVLDIEPQVTLSTPRNPIVVDISIAEKIVTKKLTVPVGTINGKAEITPSDADIEISGPENTMARINTDETIKITIDLNGLDPGVYVRRAAVNLPVDLTLVTVTPELFTLKIH